MRELAIVRRYAEAFMAYVKENIGVQKALKDLNTLRNILRESPELRNYFLNKRVSNFRKCEFIEEVLKGAVSEETRNFLKLLLRKARVEFITDIAEYCRAHFRHGQKENALLKTGFPLDLDLVQVIQKSVEAKLNKKLNLYIDLDADLLGGVKVTVGNTVIDGSIRKRLDTLKEELMLMRLD